MTLRADEQIQSQRTSGGIGSMGADAAVAVAAAGGSSKAKRMVCPSFVE